MSTLSYGDSINSFIKKDLRTRIIHDLKYFNLFSEADLQSIVYYHLRKALAFRENWFVRSNPTMRGGRPDIVVFNHYNPRVVIELTFVILLEDDYYPNKKLNDDKQKLGRIVGNYESIGKTFQIGIFDANDEYEYSLKENRDWEKYCFDEMLINVKEFKWYDNWIDEWVKIKKRQG